MRWILAALWVALSSFAMAEVDPLPAGVRSALNVRSLPAESLSISVLDVDSGESLINWQSDKPQNPASTIKLLTTLVALDVLGPTYRWKTDVFANGEIKDGRFVATSVVMLPNDKSDKAASVEGKLKEQN